MAKLHMRLSVELDITNEQLVDIVSVSQCRWGDKSTVLDVDFRQLPDAIKVAILRDRKFVPVIDGWDDVGYIPDSWLTYDAVESGLYEANEDGLRRKEA